MTYEEHIADLVNRGFVTEQGAPLKCFHCESEHLEEGDSFYEEMHGQVEYSVRCKKCGEHVVTWSYGGWSP